VFKLFYVVSLFVCNVCYVVTTLLNAQVHTSTEATLLNVSSEIFTISSRTSCLSALKSTGRLLYTTLLKKNPQKKSYVLLGPVNVGTMTHNRNEKASAAETNDEARINIKLS